jgi:tetraacyldisaccharide 4'-kinase
MGERSVDRLREAPGARGGWRGGGGEGRTGGLEWLWFGDDFGAKVARLALWPLEMLYAMVWAVRSAAYDRGILAARVPPIPAIGVGNLTVGGTGKTPVAAWLTGRLASEGARPAIVLRGYGGDEPLVHRQLNPDLPVITSADRLTGIAQAAAAGADVAVLDDAFQHRRVRCTAHVVLVSADRWTRRRHLLPVGPWREPLGALRRASVIVVTRKACSLDAARAVGEELLALAPGVPHAIMHLGLGALHRLDAPDWQPVERLTGERVLALAAIGDPGAFVAQLEARGARVRAYLFPDHHRFTPMEVDRLARDADAGERVVCTLKDAVKLAARWPRQAPYLWYVSQHLEVEQGQAALDALVAALLDTRHRQP